jgi:hypothetical protein
MSTTSKTTCPRLLAAVSSMLAIPFASAATITQTVNSGSTTSWNDAMWGTPAAAPSAGNDYVTAASGSSTTIYSINSVSWSQLSWTVQNVDSNNVAAASTSSTFAGDSLTVATSAPINGRATGGSIQTANLIFDGGFYRGNVLGGAAEGLRSSTLAGGISFATPTTVAAIGMNSPTNDTTFAFNINSAVTGAVGNQLQLTMNGGGTNRNVHFSLTGDLSSYYGTIYAGVAGVGGIAVGVSTDSFFSITSDAVNATVQLDTTTSNFQYNLGSGNVTFGALSYGNGAGISIEEGVYDADDLNTFTGTSAFFGDGTITVLVPEPGTAATLATLCLGLAVRRRRDAVSPGKA